MDLFCLFGPVPIIKTQNVKQAHKALKPLDEQTQTWKTFEDEETMQYLFVVL